MKYMNWSYPDLCSCPAPYLEGIVRHAEKEAAEAEDAERQANR